MKRSNDPYSNGSRSISAVRTSVRPCAIHIHALALYFAFYNFCRTHKTLRISPAMAAGITDRLWSLDDIVARIDADAPAPKARGPYKPRNSK